jgi:aspartate/tyrosine/aromatic aminotransferase
MSQKECQRLSSKKSLNKGWHRVIVRYKDKDNALKWLDDMNIVAHWQDFNNDYFEDDLNTIQFIFYESEDSDLTCATSFAKLFSLYDEVRSYEV